MKMNVCNFSRCMWLLLNIIELSWHLYEVAELARPQIAALSFPFWINLGSFLCFSYFSPEKHIFFLVFKNLWGTV